VAKQDLAGAIRVLGAAYGRVCRAVSDIPISTVQLDSSKIRATVHLRDVSSAEA